MANDVRTHHLGMRGALTIWAARRVCHMVRTHPPAWRGRGARRLDARALDHWTHAPLSATAAGCHGRSSDDANLPAVRCAGERWECRASGVLALGCTGRPHEVLGGRQKG